MAICAFLGNENVYSDTLCPKLRKTLKELMDADGSLELLLTPSPFGNFFGLCLKIALEMKTHNPDRTTITLVAGDGNGLNESFFYRYGNVPICAIDCIRVADIPPVKGHNYFQQRYNLRKFLIQCSTHVICCVYERAYETLPNRLLAFAKTLPTTELIDLSDIEITEELERRMPSLLTYREMLVLQRGDSGYSRKQIGAEIGASTEWTRQIGQKAGLKIRKYIERRYPKRRVMGGHGPRLVCAIFLLEDAASSKVKMFQQIIEILICKYHVTLFEMPGKCLNSPFAKVLAKKRQSYYFRLSAIVTDEVSLETGIDEDYILRRFCPPVDYVENIDTTLMPFGTSDYKMIAGMIEQADFCICDLSISPIREEIKKLISRSSNVSLLDISRNTSLIGSPDETIKTLLKLR